MRISCSRATPALWPQRCFPKRGQSPFSARTGRSPTKLFLGGCTGFSCFFEGKLGVCAESKKFFAALKSVFQAPAFGAAWRDIEKEAVAVKELLRLVSGLYATYCGICEGHGGYRLLARGYIPPEVPPTKWAIYGFFEPSPDNLFPPFPCQERIFRLCRTRLF